MLSDWQLDFGWTQSASTSAKQSRSRLTTGGKGEGFRDIERVDNVFLFVVVEYILDGELALMDYWLATVAGRLSFTAHLSWLSFRLFAHLLLQHS